jgi:hypothetical protein
MTKSDPQPITFRWWWHTMPEKGLEWTARDEFNELSDRSLTEQLTTIRSRGALAEGEIAVISVLRNEATRLPIFFDHYKRLGVTRFFMVDNDSNDGSQEILLAEPSADVFHTTTPYKEGQMGVYWYNGLARAYCQGHWTVTADADELLVYDGMGEHNLHALAEWLDNNQFDRLFALMVDVYPSGTIGKGTRAIGEILETDCWFDEFGYQLETLSAGFMITGGVRDRLFNKGPEAHPHWLSKYPFFRMKGDMVIFDAHFLWPYGEDPAGPMSALIHLKLMDDFVDRSKQAEEELQHVLDSNAYRIINARLAENPDIEAYNEESCRYTGPDSLVEHRMIGRIDWRRSKGPEGACASEPQLYWASTMPLPGASWRRKDEFNEISNRSLSAHLKLIRSEGELTPDDLPLICVFRNEAKRLPIFFEHYKGLGVTRFIMIDNNSEDGSREIALAEPRADVYHAFAPFNAGCCGNYWQNGLARRHCMGRWVVVADADELLVYDRMEDRSLIDLAQLLDDRKQDRVLSMLLDIYPPGVIGQGNRSIEEVVIGDCYFDSEGYHVTRDGCGWAIRGGARTRLFESKEGAVVTHLSKFPFFRMKNETVIWNSHYLWPYDRVDKVPEAILLHLKLMDDLVARTKINIAESQHWSDAIHYRQIAEILDRGQDIVALHANSRRYRGPKSLIRHRLMKPLRWISGQPAAQNSNGRKAPGHSPEIDA